MGKSSKLHVGMGIHKDSIDVATGDDAAGEVRHYGAIGGEMGAVSRLCRKLESTDKVLLFAYEAGPCGFGIYRGAVTPQLGAAGNVALIAGQTTAKLTISP